jgi:hypothetical protein
MVRLGGKNERLMVGRLGGQEMGSMDGDDVLGTPVAAARFRGWL